MMGVYVAVKQIDFSSAQRTALSTWEMPVNVALTTSGFLRTVL